MSNLKVQKYSMNPNPIPYIEHDSKENYYSGTETGIFCDKEDRAKRIIKLTTFSRRGGASDLITDSSNFGGSARNGSNAWEIYQAELGGKIIDEGRLEARIIELIGKAYPDDKAKRESTITDVRNYFGKINQERADQKYDPERIADKWAIKDNFQSIIELRVQNENLIRQQKEVDQAVSNPGEMDAHLATSQDLPMVAVAPSPSDLLGIHEKNKQALRKQQDPLYHSTPQSLAYKADIIAAKHDVGREISHCVGNIDNLMHSRGISEFKAGPKLPTAANNAGIAGYEAGSKLLNYLTRGFGGETKTVETRDWEKFAERRDMLLLSRALEINPGSKHKKFEFDLASLRQKMSDNLERNPNDIEFLKQDFLLHLELINKFIEEADEEQKKFTKELNKQLTEFNNNFLDNLGEHDKEDDRLWKYRVLQTVLMMSPFAPFSLISPILSFIEPLFDLTEKMSGLISSIFTPEVTGFFGQIAHALQIDQAVNWLLDVPLAPVTETTEWLLQNDIVSPILSGPLAAAAASPLTDIAAAGLFGLLYVPQELERIEKRDKFLETQDKAIGQKIESTFKKRSEERLDLEKKSVPRSFDLEKKLAVTNSLAKWAAINYDPDKADFTGLSENLKKIFADKNYQELGKFVYENYDKTDQKDIQEDINCLLIARQRATNPVLIQNQLKIIDDNNKSDEEKVKAKLEASSLAKEEQKAIAEKEFLYKKCSKFRDPRNPIEKVDNDYLVNKYGFSEFTDLSEADKKVLAQKEALILAYLDKNGLSNVAMVDIEKYFANLLAAKKGIMDFPKPSDLISSGPLSMNQYSEFPVMNYNQEQKEWIQNQFGVLAKAVESSETLTLRSMEQELLKHELKGLDGSMIPNTSPRPTGAEPLVSDLSVAVGVGG